MEVFAGRKKQYSSKSDDDGLLAQEFLASQQGQTISPIPRGVRVTTITGIEESNSMGLQYFEKAVARSIGAVS